MFSGREEFNLLSCSYVEVVNDKIRKMSRMSVVKLVASVGM